MDSRNDISVRYAVGTKAMSSPRNMLLILMLGVAGMAFAGSAAKTAPVASTAVVSPVEQDQQWRVEGEKRYRTNCGRCHQPPHQFPPRAMAMVIRHMRVRAMLTDEDMKYVLYYMTH
jgi:mono/diheme cytochrome c family protein